MPAQTPILFTAEGFTKLKTEYELLVACRPQVVAELSEARDLGDRSENAAYKSARRKLSQTDSRLRFLKGMLSRARVVQPSTTDTVEIGATVSVESCETSATYQIVGSHESDPTRGKLSYLSPLGQQLLHKRAGETVNLHTPRGMTTYHITKISP